MIKHILSLAVLTQTFVNAQNECLRVIDYSSSQSSQLRNNPLDRTDPAYDFDELSKGINDKDFSTIEFNLARISSSYWNLLLPTKLDYNL